MRGVSNVARPRQYSLPLEAAFRHCQAVADGAGGLPPVDQFYALAALPSPHQAS